MCVMLLQQAPHVAQQPLSLGRVVAAAVKRGNARHLLGYVSFGFSDVSVVLGEALAFYSDLVHARPYGPIQLCGQRISA